MKNWISLVESTGMKLNVKGKILICNCELQYTFEFISIFVARHRRHFLKENPTPLKPPIKLEAGTSPTMHIAPP